MRGAAGGRRVDHLDHGREHARPARRPRPGSRGARAHLAPAGPAHLPARHRARARPLLRRRLAGTGLGVACLPRARSGGGDRARRRRPAGVLPARARRPARRLGAAPGGADGARRGAHGAGARPDRDPRRRHVAGPRPGAGHALGGGARARPHGPHVLREPADGGGLHEPGRRARRRHLRLHAAAGPGRPPHHRHPRRVPARQARLHRGGRARGPRVPVELLPARPRGQPAGRARAGRRDVAHRPEAADVRADAAGRERGQPHRPRQRLRGLAPPRPVAAAAPAASTAPRSTST